MADLDSLLLALKDYENLTVACNRCGFCTSYCPTYNVTGSETYSPRGRVQTLRALMENKISSPRLAEDIVDTCLLCGECTTICFSEVPTAKLMVQARNYIHEAGGFSRTKSFIIKVLLPRPGLLKWILKGAFLGKRLGGAWLLKKLGILKRFAPSLVAADNLVRKVPLRFLMDYSTAKEHSLAHLEASGKHTFAQKEIDMRMKNDQTVPEELFKKARLTKNARVAYFPVCGSQYLRPSVGLAAFRLLKRLNLDYVIPPVVCCGLPAASYGVVDQVQKMALKNIEEFERGNYEFLVADDSSCVAHLKDYPDYFQNQPEILERVKNLSARVCELSTFLLEKGLLEHLTRARWSGGPIAYHDPCKAQYAQKITQPPRDLLMAVPGMRLIPIRESDQCCGGGGTYSFVHPEMSQDVLSRKIKNIKDAGCKILVTSSVSCLTQLQFGLEKDGLDIKVLHLAELLDQILE